VIKCIAITYGFAHVCDRCGAIGPVRGHLDKVVDLTETNLSCSYDERCSARQAGWSTSAERDLCPQCKVRP
jgi:hypothetical protein